VLIRIGAEYIFSFDFTGLEDGFLGLFVELSGHDLQFISSFCQGSLLILKLIQAARIFICKLFMLLAELIQSS
jgi:hypothetical protein